MTEIKKSIYALKQDNCADGCHVYVYGWHDGVARCSCGAVLPEERD